jgi:hypothetical protein
MITQAHEQLSMTPIASNLKWYHGTGVFTNKKKILNSMMGHLIVVLFTNYSKKLNQTNH